MMHQMFVDPTGVIKNFPAHIGSRANRCDPCRVCGLPWPRKDCLAHSKECSTIVFLQDPKNHQQPLMLHYGVVAFKMLHLPDHAGIGGLLHVAVSCPSTEVWNQYDVLIDCGRFIWGNKNTLRASHPGLMQAIGRNRFGQDYKGTKQLQSMAEGLYQELQETVFRRYVISGLIDFPSFDVCNAFFGVRNYQPRDITQYPDRAPPPEVAAIFNIKSCKDECETCKMDCNGCAGCCLHRDQDRGLTTAIFRQMKTTPKKFHAFFCLNHRAYSIRGGLAVVFDGSKQLHGVWGRPDTPEMYGWSGCAFVHK